MSKPEEKSSPMIELMSFGFKYGYPRANYFFDVGFIKNPARHEAWGFFSEPNQEMQDFVLQQTDVAEFIEKVEPLILFLSSVDQFQVFALGCNAGRHRSYILVDELAKRLNKHQLTIKVTHRETGEMYIID